MKKIILVFALIISLILCLTSCENGNQHKEALDKLNQLASKDYARYSIEITVESQDGHLTVEKYDVSSNGVSRTVNYRIERLNPILIDGDSINLPEGYKTVSEGVLDQESSANEKFAFPTFSFTSKNLTVSKDTNHGTYAILAASAKSVSELFGRDIGVSTAVLEVRYEASSLTYLTISTTSGSGNLITVTYTVN